MNHYMASLSLIQETARVLGEHSRAEDGNYVGLQDEAIELLGKLKGAMFPHIFSGHGRDGGRMEACVRDLLGAFAILQRLLKRVCPEREDEEERALALIAMLPEIQSTLESDVLAAYQGDPAARSCDEVMLTYPAFEAISSYRIAHGLYTMGVPILPRMITEYAHRITGIDIHPGAVIGKYFFIDHGTGVVIGETTTIGEHVKLYQGVTLGAKSFEVGADGTLVKGIKRHPDIGSDVVIYSGATILGGETVIGDHCVIGGNVWLTHSVPAGETVLATREGSV